MIRKILRKVSFRLSLWQALIFAILAIVLSYVTHTLIVEQIRTHEQEVVSFRLSEFTLEYERGGVEAVKALANARRKRAQKVFFVRLASAENKTIFLRDPEDWLEFNSDLLRKVPVPKDARIHWMELNAQDGNALYLAMHRLGDGFPGLNLRFAPNARHIGIALRLVADGGGFADDERRALLRVGALRVVAGHARMCQGARCAVAR